MPDRSLLYRLVRSRQFALSIVLVPIAFLMNGLASIFIQAHFPDRPQVPDLLFRSLPYLPQTQYLTDVFDISSPILVAAYFFEYRTLEFAWGLCVYCVAELLRAGITVLTPLGGPLGNVVNYGLTTIHQHGQFPSGHTMEVAIGFMLVDAAQAPALKRILLIMVLGEIACLLLSHGHYSIDIVGGLLLAHFTYHEMARYKPRFIPA